MKRKSTRYITEIGRYPSLEELLFAMNGMKKDKMLLKHVRRNADGEVVACFTKKGGVLYERMFSLLHGILTLAEVKDADAIFEHIQETIDEIANGES